MKKLLLCLLVFLLSNCQIGIHSGDGLIQSRANNRNHHMKTHKYNCDFICEATVIGLLLGVSVIMIFIIYLATLIYKCFGNSKIQKEKLKIFDPFLNTNNFSNEQQLQEIMKKIERQSWKMKQIQNESHQAILIQKIDVYITGLNEFLKNPYLKIKIECSDINGKFTLEGVIKCGFESLSIILIKECKNVEQTERNDDYIFILYEGQSKNIDEGFEGIWYFQNQNKSGDWTWRS